MRSILRGLAGIRTRLTNRLVEHAEQITQTRYGNASGAGPEGNWQPHQNAAFAQNLGNRAQARAEQLVDRGEIPDGYVDTARVAAAHTPLAHNDPETASRLIDEIPSLGRANHGAYDEHDAAVVRRLVIPTALDHASGEHRAIGAPREEAIVEGILTDARDALRAAPAGPRTALLEHAGDEIAAGRIPGVRSVDDLARTDLDPHRVTEAIRAEQRRLEEPRAGYELADPALREASHATLAELRQQFEQAIDDGAASGAALQAIVASAAWYETHRRLPDPAGIAPVEDRGPRVFGVPGIPSPAADAPAPPEPSDVDELPSDPDEDEEQLDRPGDAGGDPEAPEAALDQPHPPGEEEPGELDGPDDPGPHDPNAADSPDDASTDLEKDPANPDAAATGPQDPQEPDGSTEPEEDAVILLDALTDAQDDPAGPTLPDDSDPQPGTVAASPPPYDGRLATIGVAARDWWGTDDASGLSSEGTRLRHEPDQPNDPGPTDRPDEPEEPDERATAVFVALCSAASSQRLPRPEDYVPAPTAEPDAVAPATPASDELDEPDAVDRPDAPPPPPPPSGFDLNGF